MSLAGCTSRRASRLWKDHEAALQSPGSERLSDQTVKTLDKLYRYSDSVEAPLRCTEYFEMLAGLSSETLNEFDVSERDMRHRLH